MNVCFLAFAITLSVAIIIYIMMTHHKKRFMWSEHVLAIFVRGRSLSIILKDGQIIKYNNRDEASLFYLAIVIAKISGAPIVKQSEVEETK